MKSFSACMLVTLGLLAALPAQAQIYKCKDAAGRVTLQQTRCPGVGAMVATPAETAPRHRTTPPESNPDARHLTSLIAGHLARRDYQRAESLAVTTEHYAMINEAKRLDAEAKLREAEAKAKARATLVPLLMQPRRSGITTCQPNGLGGMNCNSY